MKYNTIRGRTGRRWGVLFLTLLAFAPSAWANCVDLTVTTWTEAQKQRAVVIAALFPSIGEPLTAKWVTKAQAGQVARLCAETADLSALTSAGVQTTVQTYLDTKAAADAAAEAERLAALAELQTSQVCQNASLTQIDAILDTHHAAIQADIDAMTNIATAKTALTTQNTRQKAINRGIAKCLLAWIKHQ